MNDFTALCRTITAREKRARNLAEAEQRLDGTPWYRWMQCRSLRLRIASLRDEIEMLNSKVSSDSVLGLASSIASDLWSRAAAEIVPKKNPYGRAAQERFEEILGRAVELGCGWEVWDHRSSASFPLSGLPEVEALVTAESIASQARREISRLAAIAASPELIHDYDRDADGKLRLWVQHVASGLRATFTMDGDGFGGVLSKPYSLGSIDPKKPGTLHDWQQYTGLGIGRRIYEEAHRLEPTVRWGGGLLSEYSAPLRKRLHSADPYVWDWSSCKWCEQNLRQQGVFHWMDASRSMFHGHP